MRAAELQQQIQSIDVLKKEKESLTQQLQQQEAELESERRAKEAQEREFALAQEASRRENSQLKAQIETQQQDLRKLV